MSGITQYIEENIGLIYKKRIGDINGLELKTILENENPYIFERRYSSVGQIIRNLIDAFISSDEETIFGDLLKGLAIYVNQQVYGGWKSDITGIDLEFDKENIHYIVSIKSGPNWGNSRQIKKMKSDFATAQRTLRTTNSQLTIVAVNGCCYGKDNTPDKGDYFKYCGQAFWTFISGNENLYLDIIEPLGHTAKERNYEFQKLYDKKINKFVKQFIDEFCKENGEIDWKKLVQFNSGMKKK
ncbi:MAG: cytosolic protein [Prevotellaceae bacterium]|nr:cytosolic protein [Prevotellaceae bacterium]